METAQIKLDLIKTFNFEGEAEQAVSFVETIHVTDGVDCDVYNFPRDKSKDLGIIKIGELMQWQADNDSELVASEICFPPYEDGRYENIME